jgi:hypothetical protein
MIRKVVVGVFAVAIVVLNGGPDWTIGSPSEVITPSTVFNGSGMTTKTGDVNFRVYIFDNEGEPPYHGP